MDHGYTNWQKLKSSIIHKRLKFILISFLIILIISLFVFFFGYDEPLFDSHKLAEFAGGFSCLILLIFIIAHVKYKVPKYIPVCNKCGTMIKDINKDCAIGKIKFIGTIDKTIYEKTTANVKGTTTYPRGGYSMRNSVYEKTSETTYEIKGSVPLIKKFYIYNIEYCCKNCKELFCTVKKESIEPIDTNE